MTSLGSVGDKGGPKKLLGPPYSPEKHSRICYCFVRGKNHQKTNTFTSDRSNPSIHRQNPGPSAMLAGIAQRRADGILNPENNQSEKKSCPAYWQIKAEVRRSARPCACWQRSSQATCRCWSRSIMRLMGCFKTTLRQEPILIFFIIRNLPTGSAYIAQKNP